MDAAPAWGVRPISTQVAAVAISTGGMLPVMLVGALAVQMRRDLGFSNTGLGIAVAAFFLASAAGSALAGAWNDRIGVRTALVTAAASSVASLVATASLARTFGALVAALLVGTVAAALSTPATNSLVAGNVPANRQGLAHGAKQAAIPLAGLLAGLAVPAFAVTIGWRWAFAAAALVPAAGGLAALLASGTVVRGAALAVDRPGRLDARSRGTLLSIALGAGLAAAAVTSLNSFLVIACTEAGLAEATAGAVAAVASGIVIGVRLAAGLLADRLPGDRFGPVSAMLAAAVVGYVLLATDRPVAMVIGAVFALGVGWGWPGMLTLAVVEQHPQQPGAATGVVMTGVYTGAVIGPIVIALVEGATSFSVAWLVAALLSLAAAGTLVAGRSRRGSRGPAWGKQGQ